MIAVTGATGQLGTLVIDALLRTIPASRIIAAVRNPAKANALAAKGVVVREADYDRPATLDAAFAGVENCCSSLPPRWADACPNTRR